MQKLVVTFVVPLEPVASGVSVKGVVFPLEAIVETRSAVNALALFMPEKIEIEADRIRFIIGGWDILIRRDLVKGFESVD